MYAQDYDTTYGAEERQRNISVRSDTWTETEELSDTNQTPTHGICVQE